MSQKLSVWPKIHTLTQGETDVKGNSQDERLIAWSSIILYKDNNQYQNKQYNDDRPEHCVQEKVK